MLAEFNKICIFPTTSFQAAERGNGKLKDTNLKYYRKHGTNSHQNIFFQNMSPIEG